MMPLFRTKKTAVGLDIGAEKIKLVEISLEKDKISLEKIIVQPINEKNVSAVLADIWSKYKITTHKFGLSLSAEKVNPQYAELPFMDEEDIKKALPFEIEANLETDIENYVLSSEICGEINKSGEKHSRVLYAVVHRDRLEKYMQQMSEAALKPDFLELDINALVYLCLDLGLNMKAAVMLACNKESLKLIFIKDSKVFFSKVIDKILSQEEIVKELDKFIVYLRLNFGEAEPEYIISMGSFADREQFQKEIAININSLNIFDNFAKTENFISSGDYEESEIAAPLGLALRQIHAQ